MDNDLQALATKADLRDLETRLSGRIDLMQWMQGFSLAALVAILFMLIKH